MSNEIQINPSMLTWARETAGLGLSDAAERLGLSSNDVMSAEEKLSLFEAGVRMPTRKQLSNFSAVYRRPLLTFFLNHPPVQGDRGEDFRRTSAMTSKRDNALLDALLRNVRARQEMVRDLLEDEPDFEPKEFVGSGSLDEAPEKLATKIASALRFDYSSVKSRKGGADELFKSLRKSAEHIGVFVLLIGDLGSHHSALGADVFRGFTIADEIAPFVVINDQDAKAARSFTLVHELAHLWLGRSGVSGAPQTESPRTIHERIERYCNDVAGDFLLPSKSLGPRPPALDSQNQRIIHDVISGIAYQWSVSESMVAYRLNRIGWISEAVYSELAADFAARWRVARLHARDSNRDNAGGPSYYTIRQHKLGSALLNVVSRTVRDEMLTYTKAAKVLGVKQNAVEPLLRRFEQGKGSFAPDSGG